MLHAPLRVAFEKELCTPFKFAVRFWRHSEFLGGDGAIIEAATIGGRGCGVRLGVARDRGEECENEERNEEPRSHCYTSINAMLQLRYGHDNADWERAPMKIDWMWKR
jgi:hypothetical protein